MVDVAAWEWDFDIQAEKENAILKSLVAKTDEESAKKSVMIARLKEVVWDEAYTKIKDEVIQSDDFKSITLHSNG